MEALAEQKCEECAFYDWCDKDKVPCEEFIEELGQSKD